MFSNIKLIQGYYIEYSKWKLNGQLRPPASVRKESNVTSVSIILYRTIFLTWIHSIALSRFLTSISHIWSFWLQAIWRPYWEHSSVVLAWQCQHWINTVKTSFREEFVSRFKDKKKLSDWIIFPDFQLNIIYENAFEFLYHEADIWWINFWRIFRRLCCWNLNQINSIQIILIFVFLSAFFWKCERFLSLVIFSRLRHRRRRWCLLQ